jgi:mRNA interferase RelE/StbE
MATATKTVDGHAAKHHSHIMVRVTLDAEAAEEFLDLPTRIKDRVSKLLARLEKRRAVRGAKPLTGQLAGRFRMRTGDYRLLFRVAKDEIIVERIGHRDRIYED